MARKSPHFLICLALALSSGAPAVGAEETAPCFILSPFYTAIWAKEPVLATCKAEAESIADPQEKALALLLLAEKYLEAHDETQAKAALEQSLSGTTDPINFGFTQRYARVLVKTGQFDQAIALLFRAPNKSDLEEARLAIAEGYLQKGDLLNAYEYMKAIPFGITQVRGADPGSVQLVALVGKALKDDSPRLANMAINSIRDPYDRATAFLALYRYYGEKKDDKQSKHFLDRAFDEAKVVPAVIVPHSLDNIPADRSSARLLAQLAGEFGTSQPAKARAAIQAALVDAEHEYESSKYTNQGVPWDMLGTLAEIGQQAKQLGLTSMVSPLIDKVSDRLVAQTNIFAVLSLSDYATAETRELWAAQAQAARNKKAPDADIAPIRADKKPVVPNAEGAPGEYHAEILGLHPGIVGDESKGAEIESLLEGGDVAAALTALPNIDQRSKRALVAFQIAEKALTKRQPDIALKAFDLAVQADPVEVRSGHLNQAITILVRAHERERACKLLRFAGSDYNYYDALCMMANAYGVDGDFEKALELVRAIPDGALYVKKALGDPKEEALSMIADKAVAAGKMDVAVSAINGLRDPSMRATAYQSFGKKLLGAGQTGNARFMFDQALTQALSTKARIVPIEEDVFEYESTARLLGNLAMDYKAIDAAKAGQIWKQAKALCESGEEKVCKSVYGLSPLVEKLKTQSELDAQARELGIQQ